MKIHHPVGAIAKVGSPLVDIEIDEDLNNTEVVEPKNSNHAKEDEMKETTKHSNEMEKSIQTIQSPAPSKENTIKCLPSVRKYAQTHGIDLTRIPKGTGPKGTITMADIMVGSTVVERRLTAIQRAMCKSMKQSLEIPHFLYGEMLDVGALRSLRQIIQENWKDQKLSMTALLLKSFSKALLDFPALNAHFDPERQLVREYGHQQNINIAIDTDHGLMVPCLRGVQSMGILEISRTIADLQTRAKQNRLQREDFEGPGTISLSNIGVIGGTHLAPVILAPQVCIVALGREQIQPVYRSLQDISPVLQPQIPLSISADHRVIDGALVARFTARWKEILASPAYHLLEQIK